MGAADSYVSVTGMLLERRKKSLRAQFPTLQAWIWLPRGWLDQASNFLLDKAEIPSSITIRVLGDKAVDKGLI
jgi:hypothetical protein